jgi:hypothetical protein
MPFERELTVRVTPELAARDPFHTVPFPVPEGTRSLEVSYSVGGKGSAADPPGTGNVVDLGLLDPRAKSFPSREGFRGWSGSARSEVFLAESGATPGYLPGPLPGGIWHVLLGLYRIMPGGTNIHVTVRGSEEDHPVKVPAVAPATAVSGSPYPGWYRGDLHTHTHHSDARGSLHDLLEMARRRGLDYLAVTDHNTVSHHAPLLSMDTGGLTVIPGQELTTYHGHSNVLGLDGWVDFRIWEDERMRGAIRDARERGALRVINHPKPTGCDWEYGEWSDFDLFEVWNGPWPTRNWVSLQRWHDRLAAGQRIPAVGGSDRHQPPLPDNDPPYLQVGSPTTWINSADKSPASLLAALKAGRASVSEGPDGPLVSLERDGELAQGREALAGEMLQVCVRGGSGSRLRLLGDRGTLLDVAIGTDDVCLDFAMPPARFIRAEVYRRAADDPEYVALVRQAAERQLEPGASLEEIVTQDRVMAVSNPVYGGDEP